MAITVPTTIRSSEPPTGVVEYTDTDGTGPYVLRGAFPGYSTALARFTDGQKLKYRATNGVNQEIAFGTFDAANNSITRTQIQDPTDNTPFVWGTDRKIIYIETVDEFVLPDIPDSGDVCDTTGGYDGQVYNSVGVPDACGVWGSRVIGAPAHGGNNADPAIIAGGFGDDIYAPGDVTITGGAAGAGSANDGGSIIITAGQTDTTADEGGTVGSVSIIIPDAPANFTLAGSISLQGGAANVDATGFDGIGGGVYVDTGAGSPFSNGGLFRVVTGGTVSTAGQSGDITLETGEHADFTGIIRINSGDPQDGDGSRDDAGDVLIASGRSYYGAGTQGVLSLSGGTRLQLHASNGDICFDSSQADRSFIFCDLFTTSPLTTPDSGVGMLLLDGVPSTFHIILPPTPEQGRIFRIFAATAIGSLSITAPGSETVRNVPGSLSAGQCFGLLYRLDNTTWYGGYS